MSKDTLVSSHKVYMHRQLGNDERSIWLYEQVRPIHFCLTATINGAIDTERLTLALLSVQQRHPLLRVRIEEDRSLVPWLIPDLYSIPLRVVKRHSDSQWQQEVEQELANPFDYHQAPLIRVVLLQGNDVSELIVTCAHAISDGMSSVFLLKDILQAMNSSDTPPTVLPEQPPYEQLVSPITLETTAVTFEPSRSQTFTKR